MRTATRSTILVLVALAAVPLFTAACRPVQAPIAEEQPAPVEAAPVQAAPTPFPEINTMGSEVVAAVEGVIESLMEAYSAPGLTVCIAKDGEVVYNKGFGVTTVGTDKPVTTESIFQVMNTGRTLVVVAVMQLVEQGKVDLDAPITDYLPYFEMKDDRYSQITVRHLLTDSSGLPKHKEPYADTWVGAPAQYDDEALARTVRSLSDAELEFAPGTAWSYSLFGYDLLGDLIAKVSGQTFEAYMQEHVLTPLGMSQSTYLPKQADLGSLVSPHMNKGSDVFVSDLVTDGREHGPSLGLWSSTSDMCRWMMANLNRGELDGRRILDDASYDLMWEPFVDTGNESPWAESGMGWFVGTVDDYQRLSYHGAEVGFQSNIRLDPDNKFGMVVLTNLFTSTEENGEPGYGWDVTETIMSILKIYGEP